MNFLLSRLIPIKNTIKIRRILLISRSIVTTSNNVKINTLKNLCSTINTHLEKNSDLDIENCLVQYISTHPSFNDSEVKILKSMFYDIINHNQSQSLISTLNILVNLYPELNKTQIVNLLLSSLSKCERYSECEKILTSLKDITTNWSVYFKEITSLYEKQNNFSEIQKYYISITKQNLTLDNNTLNRYLRTLLYFYKGNLSEEVIKYHLQHGIILSSEIYQLHLLCLYQMGEYNKIIETVKSLNKYQPQIIQPILLHPLYIACERINNFEYVNEIYEKLSNNNNNKELYFPRPFSTSLKLCIKLNKLKEINELIDNGLNKYLNEIGDMGVEVIFSYYCSKNKKTDEEIIKIYKKFLESDVKYHGSTFHSGIDELINTKRYNLAIQLHQLLLVTKLDNNNEKWKYLYFQLCSKILPIYKKLNKIKEIDEIYSKYQYYIPNISAAFGCVYSDINIERSHLEWKRAIAKYSEIYPISNEYVKEGLEFLLSINDITSLMNLASRYCEIEKYRDPSIVVLSMRLLSKANRNDYVEKIWKKYNNNWKGVNKEYTLLYNIMQTDKNGLKRWLLEKEMKYISDEDVWITNKKEQNPEIKK